MDDVEFQRRADDALSRLHRKLLAASDQYEFEADFNSGALAIEFEDPPAKFVVSPNSPVRQIWLSALSKSYKLEWDAVANAFVLADTGQSLEDVIADVIGRQLGEEVSL
jgi:CyaY protein